MDDSRHSFPSADEGTESYDADNEMSSHDSETDTASSDCGSSLDNKINSQDSETDTASSDYGSSLNDEKNSSCSSKKAKTTGASFSGKNKNEGSPENDQIQNNDRVNKKTSESPDENIEGRDDNDMYTSTEFPVILICEVCYKRFSDKEQLWVHKQIQSPPIIYRCEECDIRFQTECTFETHKSFKHTPNLFSPDELT